MDTEQAIKTYLDSLSQLPGSLLYRDQNQWEVIQPGDAGHILTMQSTNVPGWQFIRNYFPAMMQYNGASTYYEKTGLSYSNASNNFVAEFAAPPAATHQTMMLWRGLAGFAFLARIQNWDRLGFYVWSAAGPIACQVQSTISVADSKLHTTFFDYDPTTGAVTLEVDGQDVDDPLYGPRISTIATLKSGATAICDVGGIPVTGDWFTGQIGFMGFHQVTGLQSSDFFEANGAPKKLDIATWLQWWSQPRIWHESGKLDENRGTIGAMTKNGPIVLALPETWYS